MHTHTHIYCLRKAGYAVEAVEAWWIPSPRRGLDRRACKQGPVALPSTDPGTNGPLSYIYSKKKEARSERPDVTPEG